MTLQQLVDGIKQDSQMGEVGNNADVMAGRILEALNQAAVEFWERNDWKWGKVALDFTVPANTETPVAMDPTADKILSLGIKGQPGELSVFTEQEYRRWQLLPTSQQGQGGAALAESPGSIIGYVDRGLDASGNVILFFVPPPTTDTELVGEAKKRLAAVAGIEYVAADIPNVANPNFGFFPPAAMPMLRDWAWGRYLRGQKDSRGDAILQGVVNRVTMLIGSQRTQPAARPVTRPPDYQRWSNRKRGGRTVV